MESPATRLKKARAEAGFSSAREAAFAMGMKYETYVQHESGARGFRADRAEVYGRRFRVSPEWLLYGRGDQHQASPFPSEDDLIAMVQLAVDTEVTMQTRLSDLPRIVGSNLHAQLQRIEADREPPPKGKGTARGKDVRSDAPTTKSVPAE